MLCAGMYSTMSSRIIRTKFSHSNAFFVFKDFRLWLSGENGYFEVINRISIQYIVDVCQLTVVEDFEVINRISIQYIVDVCQLTVVEGSRLLKMESQVKVQVIKYIVYNLSFVHAFCKAVFCRIPCQFKHFILLLTQAAACKAKV